MNGLQKIRRKAIMWSGYVGGIQAAGDARDKALYARGRAAAVAGVPFGKAWEEYEVEEDTKGVEDLGVPEPEPEEPHDDPGEMEGVAEIPEDESANEDPADMDGVDDDDDWVAFARADEDGYVEDDEDEADEEE